MKTKFSSYCANGIANGCKYCVKGEKLVLFISGICKIGCYYCSLSEKRKNKDIIWANERQIKNTKELIQEAIASNATSAGITGGDPLLFMNRTTNYAKALKNKFGRGFHIHIYLPTRFVTKEKLKKLSKYIDEVRFHPEFLINNNPKVMINDIEKITIASHFFKKQNRGIELPMIPEKKKEILNFILKIKNKIGFANFNEFELSDTNFNYITKVKKYKLNESGYVVNDSKKAGLWLLKEIKKKKIQIKAHFCTAELKNNFQFKNRLKRHKILPYGKKTGEGLVEYLVIDNTANNKKLINKNKDFYIDKVKNRIILSETAAKKIISKNPKTKVYLVEEFPTFDGLEVEKQEISIKIKRNK